MVVERRLRPNIVILLLALLICLSVWQIISGPGPPFAVQPTPKPTTFTINPANTTYKYPLNTLNESDYRQLMSLRDFKFTIFNNVCNETTPFLIILVHSASDNSEKRKAIRETWGQHRDNVRLLFMLGETAAPEQQVALERENELFGDFVQGNFYDSYRNVTLKHVMVFKYVVYHCPIAKYILKTDDDVFVNVNLLMDYIQTNMSANGVSNLLLCRYHHNDYALRTWRSKWRVSFDEYPNRTYPDYCPGWALLYSPDVVFRLYKEAQNAPYLWIDDVLITGILFQRLNIKHTSNKPISITPGQQFQIVRMNSTKKIDPFIFGRPQMRVNDIRKLWNYTEIFRNND